MVFGIGINDADYDTQPFVNGKRKACPYFRKWKSMLGRCYYDKFHEKQPKYKNCSVDESWLTFSNFKAWMEKQDWKDKELDKDLIVKGNLVYSESTCCFINEHLNKFIMPKRSGTMNELEGCYYNKEARKFRACCNNPISGKREYIGDFLVEMDAHLAWKKRKHELACQLAELQEDEGVADALRKRYA